QSDGLNLTTEPRPCAFLIPALNGQARQARSGIDALRQALFEMCTQSSKRVADALPKPVRAALPGNSQVD
ncbi:MAG: hypothetical protein ACI9F9_001017, partial [Candidatus Paceibacteria bacterium]